VDSSGVSFGNLSIRDGATQKFYVTGSGTGGLRELTLADCVRVVACDFESNFVRYEGTAIPSSESLTHAAIYESDSAAGAVIHCHDANLWLSVLDKVPTTSKAAQYGTPQMACEIVRLFNNCDLHRRKILVMAGHDGGIVTFGKDLEEAFDVLSRERKGIMHAH
jgi:L-ribulose-5-phosphate 4-epimerase